MLRLKPWSARGASYQPVFGGNWPTIIRIFLALSTYPLDELSFKEMKTLVQDFILVSPRFHLVVFVYSINQENLEARGVQDFQHRWWKSTPHTLPAIKSHWAESHLEFLILLQLNLAPWGASHQPAFMDSRLTISHTCLACLPSR